MQERARRKKTKIIGRCFSSTAFYCMHDIINRSRTCYRISAWKRNHRREKYWQRCFEFDPIKMLFFLRIFYFIMNFATCFAIFIMPINESKRNVSSASVRKKKQQKIHNLLGKLYIILYIWHAPAIICCTINFLSKISWDIFVKKKSIWFPNPKDLKQLPVISKVHVLHSSLIDLAWLVNDSIYNFIWQPKFAQHEMSFKTLKIFHFEEKKKKRNMAKLRA